ncbi:TerC family protein [Actinomadura sp. CNU-125]|uniref:TerC family protein n=1 Tax=Actinomadura sp. CNU-125 TaxID=1904961 RepID=UPI0021CCED3C|nr:hypothetical protein [Actinomadura sp. CNU-125]
MDGRPADPQPQRGARRRGLLRRPPGPQDHAADDGLPRRQDAHARERAARDDAAAARLRRRRQHDLLFALDSIPAVYGVTKSAFIVFSANAFALLGLRALYFLIEGLLERLVYLSIGLSAILAFIGVKLILQFLHEDVSHSIPHIATPVSLGVILLILVVTTVASLVRVKGHPEEKAKPGALRKSRKREEEPSDARS